MRTKGFMTSLLSLILALALASCSEDAGYTVGPEEGLVLSGKGQSSGKGGGGGSNTAVTFSLSGGYETDPDFQSAVFVNDNKKRMQIEGGGGCEAFGCKDIAMTFAPDNVDVGSCTADQNPVDPATRDELIAQLSDPLQNRTFYASIEKSGAPVSEIRSVYHEGGTLDGQKYRSQLSGASAVEDPKDTFTLTGGDVWILKDGTGQSLLCPFTGAQVLTIQR